MRERKSEGEGKREGGRASEGKRGRQRREREEKAGDDLINFPVTEECME